MIVNQLRLRSVARSRVGNAIRKGTLSKATQFMCVDCGKPAECWDHRDYTKPLDVDPVCRPCDVLRGPGLPATDSPDMEIDWIKRPVREIRWRWGYIDMDSRIIHYWNVEGDVGISICGLRSTWVSFGIKSANRKCKYCDTRSTKRTARKMGIPT